MPSALIVPRHGLHDAPGFMSCLCVCVVDPGQDIGRDNILSQFCVIMTIMYVYYDVLACSHSW